MTNTAPDHGFTGPQAQTVLPATATTPDRVAVRCGDSSLTFAEVEQRALRLANVLIDHGIGIDGRWAILARNRVEWAEALVANGRTGSRVVLLNWHLTPSELNELLVDSGSTLLLVEPDLLGAGTAAAAGTNIATIVAFGDEYEALLAASHTTAPSERAAGNPLLYTGGTTGRSKGVNRSDQHRAASHWAVTPSMWGTLTGMPDEGVALVSTPLYHAMGQAVLASALARHHETVLLPRFDPHATLAAIAEHRVTTTAMVPTQFVRLLKLDETERASYDVSSIRWVLHTAAPCPRWAKQAMIEWFGPTIVELYGSSEGTGPVIATSQQWLERPGTVGKASAALELSIVDDDGHDLGPGEIGTVYAKRASGPPSYEGAPEKTAASQLPDGRFTVGDVGWLDEDGFLFLADRRVDLMLVGGSNVYPAEIEGILSQHPMVADVAVFGIPDPEFGQQIKAVIEAPTAVDGTVIEVDVAEVEQWLRERLASYKIPASFDVVDALPREAHGKLKKRLLRDPYWEQAEPA